MSPAPAASPVLSPTGRAHRHGAGHDHGRHHGSDEAPAATHGAHSHAHPHSHAHSHAPGQHHPPARPAPSLLRLSAWQRLAIALPLAGLLWAATALVVWGGASS